MKTLQESISGANMTIEVKNDKLVPFISEALKIMGEGSYARDGQTFYINSTLRERKFIKEAILKSFEKHNIDAKSSISFNDRKEGLKENKATRYKIKEGTFKDATAEPKAIRISESRFNRIITENISKVISENVGYLKGLDKKKASNFVTNEAYRRTLAEGTSNFASICSDTYHVITPETDEDGNEMDFDFDFIKWDVKDVLMNHGFTEDTQHDRYSRDNRSYPASTLGCSLDVELGCTTAYLIPLLVSGYYEGCTLDFDICGSNFGYGGDGGVWFSEYDSPREFVMDAIEGCIDGEEDSEEFEAAVNAGVSAVEAAIAKFHEAARGCTKEYSVAARFSNGETMFTPVKESNEHNQGAADFDSRDIYAIEDRHGRKIVHVLGYIYNAEDGIENPEKTWRSLEWSGLEFDINEFMGHIQSGDVKEWIESEEGEAKTYISDLTAEEAAETFNTYYSGVAPKALKYEEITENTPEGCYID